MHFNVPVNHELTGWSVDWLGQWWEVNIVKVVFSCCVFRVGDCYEDDVNFCLAINKIQFEL